MFLACDALHKNYQATISTYNLTTFDPACLASGVDVAERVRRQRTAKTDPRRHATERYLEFLSVGGRRRLTDLSRPLIRGLLRSKLPILTGLTSTYLYRSAREYGPYDEPEDVRGLPAGHFVAMTGYERKQRTVLLTDPCARHPNGPSLEYSVNINRSVCAVLLGIVTHDAHLLVIHSRPCQREMP